MCRREGGGRDPVCNARWSRGDERPGARPRRQDHESLAERRVGLRLRGSLLLSCQRRHRMLAARRIRRLLQQDRAPRPGPLTGGCGLDGALAVPLPAVTVPPARWRSRLRFADLLDRARRNGRFCRGQFCAGRPVFPKGGSTATGWTHAPRAGRASRVGVWAFLEPQSAVGDGRRQPCAERALLPMSGCREPTWFLMAARSAAAAWSGDAPNWYAVDR
jgi:hypothetical protein